MKLIAEQFQVHKLYQKNNRLSNFGLIIEIVFQSMEKEAWKYLQLEFQNNFITYFWSKA